MTTFAITGGRVIDPAAGVDAPRTVVVREGRVAAVEGAGAVPQGMRTVDAAGCWVVPGLVDLHVHLREPGQEYKETIETGARAAVAGGFTTVVAMPNTAPPVDNAALVDFVRRRGAEAGLARVLPAAAVTAGQRGEALTEFLDLKEAGAVLLTDDGRAVTNPQIMRRALEYALAAGLPIMVHEEDPGLAAGGCMHEGAVSLRLGLRGIPAAAEDVMVLRDLALAELTGGRLHIGHISTRGAVRAVREAKARGLRVTAEATPHHFTLTDAAVEGYDPNFKMAPPLREEADRAAVVEGLADGTIDAVATDHAPHATAEKEVEFEHTLNGIVGLETALGLVLRLVHERQLTPVRAIELLTAGPARVLGIAAGTLAAGAPADITIIRPDETWTVQPREFRSRSRNTPFGGWQLRGRAVRTIVGGREVFGPQGQGER